MNSIFCIPCKFNRTNPYIFDCVRNIREHHPTTDIIVIDSNSEDDSYLLELKEKYNIILDPYKNNNYVSGLIWHVYNNYKRDFYYFIHDSLMVERNISEVENYDVSSYLYFKSCFTVHENLSHEQLSNGLIGMNGPNDLVDWARDQLTKHNISEVYDFVGLVGSCFNANRSVLDKIYTTGFNNIVASNKPEECQMERLWGMVLTKFGYDLKENSIIGDYLSFSTSTQKGKNWVTKYFGLRQ